MDVVVHRVEEKLLLRKALEVDSVHLIRRSVHPHLEVVASQSVLACGVAVGDEEREVAKPDERRRLAVELLVELAVGQGAGALPLDFQDEHVASQLVCYLENEVVGYLLPFHPLLIGQGLQELVSVLRVLGEKVARVLSVVEKQLEDLVQG